MLPFLSTDARRGQFMSPAGAVFTEPIGDMPSVSILGMAKTCALNTQDTNSRSAVII
jgi:hypothetical protein